jgi:hypothetical protein
MALVKQFSFEIILKDVGGGRAPCPYCEGDEHRTIQRKRWLCLYGIPLIPREVVSVTHECTTCNRVVEFY